MSSNTIRVKRKWRARHLALCISLQCLALGFSTGLAWGDDYFNPALLDEGGNQQEKADLSLYEKGPGLAPGKYRVDIFVNNQKTDTREVNFVLDKDNRGNAILSPCLSIATLKEFGVATEKFSDLAEQNGCANLSAIPAASAQFLINQQRLLLSIPQTAINQMPRGAIAQEELDEGITALLLNYSYSSNMTASREPGHADSQSDYLNLRPGFNIGPWRLRNYSTWSRSNSDEGSTEDFSSVYTYLQRDFTALNGEYKDILSTGTTLTVAGYRYNTADFYTLQEILDSYRTDNQWSIPDRRRSREEMTINQSLGDTLGSLNLNLVKEQYWNEAQNRVSVGAGYNNSWHGISFGLNYSLNQNTQALYDGSATKSREQVFSLNVSLPLDQWLSNTWASYSMNNSQEGNAQTVSLNGSALAGNNLNWGLQWSPDSSNNAHATSLNADYRGTYGELSTGYSQDKYQRQLNYSVSGGVVAHRNGITLGQPLGETIALVKAPGSSGTAIANQNGINTDFRGYALVPYVSPWRRNTVALNTATLPDGTDVTHAAQTVTPTRGAVVRANFDTRTGSRALITLLRAGGQPVPFGASVTDRDQDGEFIVGDGGQVFVTGLTITGTLTVSWGNNASKHCHARYHVPENTQASPVISFTAQCS